MQLTFGQYEFIYNAFSFGVATFFASTLFFWLGLSQVSKKYKTAVIVTGLVTFIAGYHYVRIFGSFSEAYTAVNGVVTATGVAFNVAYRYVDWLLTVPLLLIETKPTRMVSPLSTLMLGEAFSDSAWSAGTRQIQRGHARVADQVGRHRALQRTLCVDGPVRRRWGAAASDDCSGDHA